MHFHETYVFKGLTATVFLKYRTMNFNQSQQSMHYCIIIAVTSGPKVILLLALRFQIDLVCEETFFISSL